VLAPAVAIVLRKVPVPVRALAGVLMGFQVVLASAFIWLHPSWGFAGLRSPFFADVDQRLGVALDRVMPTFDRQAALVAGGPACDVARCICGACRVRCLALTPTRVELMRPA